MLQKRESLWKQIIIDKFEEEERGWCSRGVRDGYKNEWESIRSRSLISIGSGKKVKFWNDLWCKDLTLELAFLSLFSFASDKDGWVVEVWE